MPVVISPSRLILFITCMAVLGLGGTVVLAQMDSLPEASDAGTSSQPLPAKAKAVAKTAAPKPAAKAVKEAQVAPALRSPGATQQLPNGASSITENYGAWTVNCRLNDGQKLCTLAQIQGNKQTGQRVFGIDLLTPKGGKTDGTILMPFGLKLDAGATLKLNDKDFGQTLHFSTCIPDGCLLPVSFPATVTDSMERAKTLSVSSVNLGNGQAVNFSLSLDGFPAALKRVIDLGS